MLVGSEQYQFDTSKIVGRYRVSEGHVPEKLDAILKDVGTLSLLRIAAVNDPFLGQSFGNDCPEVSVRA